MREMPLSHEVAARPHNGEINTPTNRRYHAKESRRNKRLNRAFQIRRTPLLSSSKGVLRVVDLKVPEIRRVLSRIPGALSGFKPGVQGANPHSVVVLASSDSSPVLNSEKTLELCPRNPARNADSIWIAKFATFSKQYFQSNNFE